MRDHLKKTGTNEQFKKQRNKVNSMKRKSKRNYFQKLLISKSDSRQIWKAINTLNNKHVSKSQKIIRDISAPELNEHFSNIADKVISNDRSNENDLYCLKQYVESKQINIPFDLQPMTTIDVIKNLSLLKKSGTRDLDGLDGRILKLSSLVIANSLTYLYNLCIDKNCFPFKFKRAKVIPVHKSGDSSSPSNYRPISILSVLSKPIEKHIQKSLYSYFNDNGLINESQSGFRKNYSCHTALIQLTDNILHSINENKFIGLLFVDFEKAFDVINHSLLLRKLQLYKLSPELIHLILSFLSDRKQLVMVNENSSDLMPVRHGVPQGSVLGPILFSIYVNDLPCFVKCKCEMFADDTSLCSSNSDSCRLTSDLQVNIDRLIDWTQLNHMSLNAHKTKCMYVSARQKRQKMKTNFEPLYIDNRIVEEVNSHKILGVIIDKDLTWTDHVMSLGKRLSTKLLQLSKIKNFLDNHSRKLFFCGHVLPLIDYASTLWDSCSETNLKFLHRLYKRALKLVLLKSSSLTVSDYKQLNILTFRNRLFFNKAVCMQKVINGNAPPKITQAFKINHYRHNHSLTFPRPRNNLYKSSFLYSGGNLWNNLPVKYKSIPNRNLFKKLLKNSLLSNCTENEL